MRLNFKKLTSTAKLPTKSSRYSAGFDFYIDEDVILEPHSLMTVDTGISWHPEDYQGEIGNNSLLWLNIRSRSGLAIKKHISVTTAGVIDQDYRGEMKLQFNNHTDDRYVFNQGDKVAQGILEVTPIPEDVIYESNRVRGENGFGSSGY
ncbi:MAG: hypothetical protein PF569_03815 [Candidatus Woesearchaeota archaeon]|jgi:dUTP pyrophosphatase|nr:hypothetical protein [Candidatus Woesearchaeota archaeon]